MGSVVKITIQIFFQKEKKKKKWKTLMKYPEYIETFAILGKHEVLEDEILKVLENFV